MIDGSQVVLDGLQRDIQALCDLGVRPTVRHLGRELLFPLGESFHSGKYGGLRGRNHTGRVFVPDSEQRPFLIRDAPGIGSTLVLCSRMLQRRTAVSRSGGRKLRTLRLHLGLTFRDVERESKRVASSLGGNSAFHVSASRLHGIETQGRVPSVYCFFSLARIYRRNLLQVLGWYGIPRDSR